MCRYTAHVNNHIQGSLERNLRGQSGSRSALWLVNPTLPDSCKVGAAAPQLQPDLFIAK